MGLTKLGIHIQQFDQRNTELKYQEDSVVGLSTQKIITQTKANLEGVSLKSYKLFPPKYFAYVSDTSRRGDKVSLAFNDTENTYLVSSISTVFFVKDENQLASKYLFMYFNRPEFDRYARFNSWGSARETFSWEDLCDIDIELPDIEVQQKYVDIYKAMVANQQSYERGLEDLKLVCDGYIEDLRRNMPCEKIGSFICQVVEKNIDGKITLEQGVNIQKKFITPQRPNSNLTNRKIVKQGQFAYCTQLNNENVAVAYRTEENCVVSSVYDVFEITKPQKLIPEYLMLWLIRPEFGRFVYWASEGSAYEFLNYDNLANYKIPIPDINIQRNIAHIYNTYLTRQRINEQLKSQIKDICPILIRGSLEEI